MKFPCEEFFHLSCSFEAKSFINHAVRRLPADVFECLKGRLAIVCVDSSDACRLTSEFCEGRELIILSERIVPRGPLPEGDRRFRYFVFAVLHEIAHALCDHKSPIGLAIGKIDEQEDQADGLAYSWFNSYLTETAQSAFTPGELQQAKTESERAWEQAFGQSRRR